MPTHDMKSVDDLDKVRSTQIEDVDTMIKPHNVIDTYRSYSPEYLKEAEKKLVRKVDKRLLPLVVVIYLFNYLDRNSITQARLYGLQKDTHVNGAVYQTAISIFSAGYIAMQLPSTMLMTKLRPSLFLVSFHNSRFGARQLTLKALLYHCMGNRQRVHECHQFRSWFAYRQVLPRNHRSTLLPWRNLSLVLLVHQARARSKDGLADMRSPLVELFCRSHLSRHPIRHGRCRTSRCVSRFIDELAKQALTNMRTDGVGCSSWKGSLRLYL